jgi:ATP-binding cassette subfamily B protein
LVKIKKFACDEVANLDYKKNFYQFKFNSIGAILFCLMLSSILFFAAYLKGLNIITTGDFIYIVTIIYKIIYDIWLLSENIGRFFDKIGDFKSSFAILQVRQELIDKPLANNLII